MRLYGDDARSWAELCVVDNFEPPQKRSLAQPERRAECSTIDTARTVYFVRLQQGYWGATDLRQGGEKRATDFEGSRAIGFRMVDEHAARRTLARGEEHVIWTVYRRREGRAATKVEVYTVLLV